MSKIWQSWKKISERIGNFQTAVIFSVLYFLIVTPLGLVSSIFNDFLSVKRDSGWQRVKDNTSTREKIKKQ